jgi:hypothetical protein
MSYGSSDADAYRLGYRHKTLWDEYCHEVQNGPHDLLEWAWDATVDSILDKIVGAVPGPEGVLLTIGAVWDLDEDDEKLPSTSAYPDLMRRNLRRVVDQIAMNRDISRFDPNAY